MLKHRIIPTLLFDGSQCVKPVSFERPYRKLGTMEQYIRVMERRNIDELIMIDIEATAQNREPNYEKIRSYCNSLFCPVTYGGGISTLDHISKLLNNGADKVAIHTACLSDPFFIEKAARKFGSQAIVGVLHSEEMDNIHWVCTNNIIEPGGGFSAWSYAQELEQLGCGEILLTDIDKDGTMEGYNYDLIYEVVNAVKIPVVALGGCGIADHMAKAIQIGASAVAAGSLFLYSEATPRDCAKYLDENNIPVRV